MFITLNLRISGNETEYINGCIVNCGYQCKICLISWKKVSLGLYIDDVNNNMAFEKRILTHIKPMFPLEPPENIRKP